MNPIIFNSREALTDHLVIEVSRLLKEDLASLGEASLAVSGGRTPIAFFEALSVVDLDWSNVLITLVDERWVEPDSEASNERLVRTHLLQNNASDAIFVPHKTTHDSPFDAIEQLDEHLDALPDQFSVVILGMGEDGHTASFFPGATTLAQCIDLNSTHACCATTPLTAQHDRMTLTLPRILKSRQLVLHLTGDGKLPVLENALNGTDVDLMPVRSVLNQSISPVSIYFAP